MWWRVFVPRDWHLGDLRIVIQTALGWSGTHCHAFIHCCSLRSVE
ncbi:hypothetical protein [Pseudoruegeria sp. SK021]